MIGERIVLDPEFDHAPQFKLTWNLLRVSDNAVVTTLSGEGTTKADARNRGRLAFLKETPEFKAIFVHTSELLHKGDFQFGAKMTDVVEDDLTEFKGDAPGLVWEYARMKPFFTKTGINSKNAGMYVSAFLNLSKGVGRVYMGVNNDGTITGIRITPDEWDELQLIFTELMKNIDPPIIPSLVSLEKFPVTPALNQPAIPNHWLVQVVVRPDEKHRLYWFEYVCYIRRQGSIAKILPPEIWAHL